MGGDPADLASLTALLAARLGERAPSGTVEDRQLATTLSSILETAREAWPTVRVTPEAFVSYLVERVERTDDPLAALAQLRASDLYLACACARGDTEALSLFETHYTARIATTLRRLDLSETRCDEVQQRLRHHLFVSRGQAPPHITKYSARGSLGSWIRVTTLRLAMEVLRQEAREIPTSDDLMHAVVLPSGDDPELRYLKHQYQREFKEAFGQAMASLTSRERNLLRHQLLDGLSIDQIGALYKAHRSTAARWLDKVRQTLAQRIRSSMTKQLGLPLGEYESIVRMINSQIELSISRYLRTTGVGSDTTDHDLNPSDGGRG